MELVESGHPRVGECSTSLFGGKERKILGTVLRQPWGAFLKYNRIQRSSNEHYHDDFGSAGGHITGLWFAERGQGKVTEPGNANPDASYSDEDLWNIGGVLASRNRKSKGTSHPTLLRSDFRDGLAPDSRGSRNTKIRRREKLADLLGSTLSARVLI